MKSLLENLCQNNTLRKQSLANELKVNISNKILIFNELSIKSDKNKIIIFGVLSLDFKTLGSILFSVEIYFILHSTKIVWQELRSK